MFLKLKQNFLNNKVVTGKTKLFVIGPFCFLILFLFTLGSEWQGSLVWKCCIFNLSIFNYKKGTAVFRKRFLFSRKFVSKLKYWKRSNFPVTVTYINTCRSLKQRTILEIPSTILEKSMLFLLALKWNLSKKHFLV